MEEKDPAKIIQEQSKMIQKLKKKITKLESELRIKKRKRLRIKDIVEMYSIPKSTVSNYIEQGMLKVIYHSEKVMTLDIMSPNVKTNSNFLFIPPLMLPQVTHF